MICTNLTSGYFRDMQLTKELFLPAFQELNDSLFMAHLVLQEMEVKRDVLRDPRYAYIFSVEDVKERVRPESHFGRLTGNWNANSRGELSGGGTGDSSYARGK